MALSAGNSALWSDINTIYNNLRSAQSKHGLSQTAKPYSAAGGTINLTNITNLNNAINALASEKHLRAIRTGVTNPARGDAIRANIVSTMATQARRAADTCHNDSFNSFTRNTFNDWFDGCFCENYSKRELKENIHSFTQSALDLINKTNIVDFNYKDDINKNYKVGFIADDTDSILSTSQHDRMDMYNCIGVLLKAVQELDNKVNQILIKE